MPGDFSRAYGNRNVEDGIWILRSKSAKTQFQNLPLSPVTKIDWNETWLIMVSDVFILVLFMTADLPSLIFFRLQESSDTNLDVKSESFSMRNVVCFPFICAD